MRNNPEDQKSKEFRQSVSITHYFPHEFFLRGFVSSTK